MFPGLLNIYFKLVLMFGLPMGILALVGFFIRNTPWYLSLALATSVGLLAGFAFATPMAFMQLLSVRRIIRKQNIDKGRFSNLYGVTHKAVIDFWGTLSQAHDLCLKALDNIKKVKAVNNEDENRKIYATTSINYLTSGERISISLSVNKDETCIEVHSEPISRWTIVDYGRNLRNIEIILLYITQHSTNPQ